MSKATLPEGWSLKRLDELARVTSGKRLPKGRRLSTAQTDHPYIRVTDMFMGSVDTSGIQYVPDDVFPEIAQFTVAAGDIFISCAGTLGLVGIVPESLHGANLTENANRIWSIQCDRRFLLSVLMSDRIQSVIQNIQTVGAQPKLALGRIRSFEIPCPDDPNEQQAIAAALSDADGVVAGLERVIAKKRLIKQGAMQDLLTARRRLPGFSGEWEVATLSELADIRSGGTPSTSDASLWDGDIAWVTPTDITALGGRKFLRSTSRTISRTGLRQSSAELLPEGTIVMTSRATIGECAIATIPLTTNQGFKNFIPKDRADRDFLYYLLMSQKKGFIELCSGSTFLEIGKTQLTGYTVRVAETKDEQQAIAAVLSDMDAEIQTLESRLTKARAVKEGMMQNLLTGRVRLV